MLEFDFSTSMTNCYHNAVVVLADGRHFFGRSLGNRIDSVGEVCFTTGLTGYQYTITDPSFADQIVTFTFPHIGNVGINDKDFECSRVLAKGVIMREISCASHVSSQTDLESWIIANGLTGISGVDTRALTTHLREHGTQPGIVHHFENRNSVDLLALQHIARAYTTKTVATALPHLLDHQVSTCGADVCVVDLGAKQGILNALTKIGCAVSVVAGIDNFATRVLSLNPKGIVISNGPGDPSDLGSHALTQLRVLMDSGIPILGICLGHQLLALALGAKTVKMHHGHRGSNHPVYNIETGTVEVTSQNHGYAVDGQTLPANVVVTHRSLFDDTIEGIKLTDRPVRSVQYHPEGCPGPKDSHYIFRDFANLVNCVLA